MPYIPKAEREEVMEIGDADTPGQLAYQLTTICLDYLEARLGVSSYTELAQVLGVLESVKLEFYRRMVAPYEDEKCRENGDVF